MASTGTTPATTCPAARPARGALYYQTTSKEYIEFLRNTNLDQSPTSRGAVAYDAWVEHGMSAPVAMDEGTIVLSPGSGADLDRNGVVDVLDLITVILAWGQCDALPSPCNGDTDCNRVVDVTDLVNVIVNWG